MGDSLTSLRDGPQRASLEGSDTDVRSDKVSQVRSRRIFQEKHHIRRPGRGKNLGAFEELK